MEKAENGNKVKVHYKGTLDNGTVFDTSENRDPLEFTIGSGQIIPGFDKGVIGMELNEKKTITIPAADAYGEKKDEYIITLPKAELPEGLNPGKGQQLQMKNQEGQPFLVRVEEVGDSTITIDANHPLAGEDLTFDIELVEISA